MFGFGKKKQQEPTRPAMRITNGPADGPVTGAGRAPVAAAAMQSLASLRSADPAFNEADAQERIANLFVQLQNARSDRDFASMQPHVSEEIFTQYSSEAQSNLAAGLTPMVDNIAVLSVEVEGWAAAESQELLYAKLNVRTIEYVIDNSGKLVSGNWDQEVFSNYRWVLSRPAGTQSGSAQGSKPSTLNCPNCGAVLDISKSSRCPYCDAVLNLKPSDWVVCQIQLLGSQKGRG